MVLNLQKKWKEYKISIYPTPCLVNFPLSRGLSPSVCRYFVVLPILKQNENIFSLHTNLQFLFHFTLPLHSKTTIIYLCGKWSFLLHPHYRCNPLCLHGSPDLSWSKSQILCVDQSHGCFSVFISFHLSIQLISPSFLGTSLLGFCETTPSCFTGCFSSVSFSSYSCSACSLKVGMSLGVVNSLLFPPPSSILSAQDNFSTFVTYLPCMQWFIPTLVFLVRVSNLRVAIVSSEFTSALRC